MKKYTKKILIVVIAIACAVCVRVSASALTIGGMTPEELFNFLFPQMTTTQPSPDNTTVPGTTESTTAVPAQESTVTNPINNSGTNSVTTTQAPYTYYQQQTYNPNTTSLSGQLTTSVVTTEEDSSLSFDSSLSSLFEEDTAAAIVETPVERYTVGVGLVVGDDTTSSGLSVIEIVAIVAAGILFLALIVLFIILIVQKHKKNNHEGTGVTLSDNPEDDDNSPVQVEVMTNERIAELLGSATKSGSMPRDYSSMSGAESAAAIKNAALYGSLSAVYSDPLLKKYTQGGSKDRDESQLSSVSDDSTGAEILKATDSMLEDITGNEKYASDTRGVKTNIDDIDSLLSSVPARVCPECGKPVGAADVFCHNCGAYAG